MSKRFIARESHGTYDLIDTQPPAGCGRPTGLFIGGVGHDLGEVNRLVEVANRLGDDAWTEDVWLANALGPDRATEGFGKTREYWESLQR